LCIDSSKENVRFFTSGEKVNDVRRYRDFSYRWTSNPYKEEFKEVARIAEEEARKNAEESDKRVKEAESKLEKMGELTETLQFFHEGSGTKLEHEMAALKFIVLFVENIQILKEIGIQDLVNKFVTPTLVNIFEKLEQGLTEMPDVRPDQSTKLKEFIVTLKAEVAKSELAAMPPKREPHGDTGE
jgi:hypothetical protein